MSSDPPRPLHILLVEDEDIDVLNAQRAFAQSGHGTEVHVARDGVEALAALRDGSIPSGRRLVLLDLGLPRMNGLELLRALRADPALRATPVVVLTTSSDDRDRIEAFDLAVAGYLHKPVTFERLADLLGTVDRYWSVVELP